MSNHRIRRVHPRSSLRGGRYVLWPVWAVGSITLLFGVFLLVREYRAKLPKKSDIPVVALGEGQDLHLDASKSSLRQLHLFEVSAMGKKAKVVVQQTDDKTVHVALASCRACYRNRDRHYAKQEQMICGKCNMPMNFESKDRKASTNSCTLVEIPHMESNGNISVLTRDVLAQAANKP